MHSGTSVLNKNHKPPLVQSKQLLFLKETLGVVYDDDELKLEIPLSTIENDTQLNNPLRKLSIEFKLQSEYGESEQLGGLS